MSTSSNPASISGVEPPEFELRAARADDFGFARRLYMNSMKPLLMALDAWNADEMEMAFRSYFIPDEIKFVTLDGRDVGWFQVSETDHDVCIDQLYLIKDVRGQGIGTALVKSIISEAADQDKNVCLSFVHGNPAHTLYRRLGFRQVSEDDTKIHMRYETRQAG
ncbi:GNAT family N-acetyltransferase [uncultured Roseobacter sp.]|uniref:GNAT family N-acetyltransferase n=1 Tax=uncultured Roseobacter sp. TaxID=114847 RepID=UPI00261A983F|nr:GNAT family N-acetyltransferase [uncultured Roseobacter sp.]